jgi:3-oxoacyl-[acyl-carrier-protein] synthase II
MKAALKRAGLQPSDLDYVNAHGTSTMADWIELRAIETLVGDHAENLAVSSTKSMTGHLLGAAGAIESIFSVLAIRDQTAPPTINLDNPEEETAIDLVPHKGKPMKIDVAMSNSFGFGGTNASVIFRKVD